MWAVNTFACTTSFNGVQKVTTKYLKQVVFSANKIFDNISNLFSEISENMTRTRTTIKYLYAILVMRLFKLYLLTDTKHQCRDGKRIRYGLSQPGIK